MCNNFGTRTSLGSLVDFNPRFPDALGDTSYNIDLSQRRADTVAFWLQSELDGLAITAAGLGVAFPIAPNTEPDGSDNPDGRQLKRRVEIVATRAE